MTELWTPNPDRFPDASNVFDMMVVFQGSISELDTKEEKLAQAVLALRTITVAVSAMKEEFQELTVETSLAIVDSTEEVKRGAIVRDLGMRGIFLDVDCISLGERIPPTLAISMDVFDAFPISSPEDSDYFMSLARAPITDVRSVELISA